MPGSTELKERTAGLESVPLHAIDNSEGTAVQQVLDLTNGLGVDLVVEAIGVPVGWYICQDIVKAGDYTFNLVYPCLNILIYEVLAFSRIA